MKNLLTRVGLPLAAVGLLVFAIAFVGGQDQATPPSKPAVPPPQSPFEYTVAGAGLVEAQTENIAVGSPTPGVVTKVFVKVDQKVKSGEPLFALDDRQHQAELANRKAALEAARTDLVRMENEPRPEELRMAQAQLAEARANLISQQDQYARAKELYARKAETAENVIIRKQLVHAAEAQVARAQAEYDMREKGAWEFDLSVARSRVKQAEAQVAQTMTELDRLVVRTLVDGRVLQVNVRPGEFVGAPPGQALIVLGNIEQLHVRVDIDENDIPRYVPGSPGIALVRGQPGMEFPLTFVRVEPYVVPKRSLTGENTERVDTRVLQVIYAIDSKGQPLYVGQQLDVYIKAPQEKAEGGRQKAEVVVGS
jgi:multidrug resistance efflux pump